MARRMMAGFIAIAAMLALRPAPARSQGVLVAPQSIIIDHRKRSGTFELFNPSNDPAEVTITTIYGYPVTDSVGTLGVRTTDAPGAGDPSAASWLQAFPKRITLRAQERQTVRLLARPPEGLPDGEYWTRLVVAAKGGALAAAKADSAPVSVALSIEVRTMVAALYRKGPVTTGVVMRAPSVTVQDSMVRVRVRFTREGNAAYLGTVKVVLTDAAGKVVASLDRRLAVYFPIEPAFDLGVRGLPAGVYRATISATTDRDDIAPELVLRAPAASVSVSVTLPASPR